MPLIDDFSCSVYVCLLAPPLLDFEALKSEADALASPVDATGADTSLPAGDGFEGPGLGDAGSGPSPAKATCLTVL